MEIYTRQNDGAQFQIKNNIVIKLSKDGTIVIPGTTITAKRIKRLANNTASDGIKKKFGLYKEPEKTKKTKNSKKEIRNFSDGVRGKYSNKKNKKDSNVGANK